MTDSEHAAALKAANDSYELGRKHGRTFAIEDVLSLLTRAGEHHLIAMLKVKLGYQEPGHVCAMVSGECIGCGARE